MGRDIPLATTEQTTPPITLERFLPYRLAVLSNVVSNAVARIYGERFDLTIPQWRVIATLGQYGVLTARDIAAHAVLHKSTVSRAVAPLCKRGLVAREANPEDMREALLVLTAAGQAVYAAIAPEALAFSQRLESVLSEAERATLFALIERLDAHARAAGGDQLGEERP
jgi:DNA-binding MarR family transcriptional regulator